MKVAIIMGSTTDLKVMQDAATSLKEFGIPYHIEIISAHRDPEKMVKFAKTARDRGFSLIIAGAGAAAHLPGMVACLTHLPVIGVPIQIGKMKGIDALLSIAQMPKGIPVATVAVDNATNAGILAARILGVSNPKIEKKLLKFQKSQISKVKKMNQELKKKKLTR
ncbi:MAG: 5-(carboxyamino)imidazole ribonucleotide mutase [Pseudobdellovibrionaceae bacterium]